MAKFFKNYNIINLKILNNELDNIKDDGLDELNVKPKYLAMTHMKHCDFCNNDDNGDTYVDEIVLLFGYQVCSTCSNKNIGKTYIKKWYVDNNSLPFIFFESLLPDNHPLKCLVGYQIQRSNGVFEDGWKIDRERSIKYEITKEDTEDILVPLYKGYDSPTRRIINKNVYLSELCRFNNLNEIDVINHFKKSQLKYIE